MLEPKPPAEIDLSAWVQKARSAPAVYRQRQVTEILLNAVSLTLGFENGLFLKGGILMALAYGSPRNTGDVDFSVVGDPEEVEKQISSALNKSLADAARRTGHVNIVCKVQRIVKRPKPASFADARFPALEIVIASANRTNPSEMARLEASQAAQVVRVDLSFREPIDSVQQLVLKGGRTVQAYGLYDLLAEKLRALLQGLTRPNQGQRRQDVYDLGHLLQTFDIDTEERAQILAILRHKSRERDLEPVRGMISNDIIVEKARAGWPTLQDELEEKLPDFNSTFGIVSEFYDSLPWDFPEVSPTIE